ncbi:MAG: right-handed parallel beta-helix repeat-containing protein, partial [Candidatus Sumerlaeota bacterium]|nr:right-handed parallel beta-helix repeat-containing protein [Candidatus Sumerlaeota bacterium]
MKKKRNNRKMIWQLAIAMLLLAVAGFFSGKLVYASSYGDISGDGQVSAYDAALAGQGSVGLLTLTQEQEQQADVSGDGAVSAYDAALIAQYAVGLIAKFPADSASQNGVLVYSEDFSDGDFANADGPQGLSWEIVSGTANVAKDSILFSNNNHLAIGRTDSTILNKNFLNLQNYTFEVSVSLWCAWPSKIIFSYLDANNYYFMSVAGNYGGIYRVMDGVYTKLSSDEDDHWIILPNSAPARGKFKIYFENNNEQIKIQVDKVDSDKYGNGRDYEVAITDADSEAVKRFKNEKIGFNCYDSSIYQSWFAVDDIKVYSGMKTDPQRSPLTFYVDYENGNDLNDGLSPSKAWKHSLGDQNAVGDPLSVNLFPGDTISFKGGVKYFGEISLGCEYCADTNNKGTDGSPINFVGDKWPGLDGTQAILDGSERINTAWTRCASPADCYNSQNYGNIYYTTLPDGIQDPLTALYEDDAHMYAAQAPNPNDFFVFDNPVGLKKLNTTSNSVTAASIQDPEFFNSPDPDYWNGAYLLAWTYPNIIDYRIIKSYNPQTNTTNFDALTNDYQRSDGNIFYAVLGHPALIDTPGEYAFDQKTNRLYIYPRPGNPADRNYFVSRLSAGVHVMRSTDHIKFSGFLIQKYSANPATGAGMGFASSGKNIIFENNTVRLLKSLTGLGNGAVSTGGDNATVKGNKIYDNQRNIGVMGSGNNVSVVNNFVSKCSREGIWFMEAYNSKIVGNTVTEIFGVHSNSISVYQNSHDILIANNHVFNSSRFTILTLQKSKNIYIINNIFEGCAQSWGGAGVEVINIALINNLIFGDNLWVDSGYLIRRNNILVNGTSGDHTHNIYIDGAPSVGREGVGDIVGIV